MSEVIKTNYRRRYEDLNEKMIHHERKKGNEVQRVFEQGWTLYLKVGDCQIRVFCSDHTGGIMAEDGVAISVKVYGILCSEPKSFIRVVAIKEKKFKDYPLNAFKWKIRKNLTTMRASLSVEQKEELLHHGEKFD